MSYDAWGSSWGTPTSAWGVSWVHPDRPPVTTVVDTHDGKRKRKQLDERIAARERLRQQIMEASGFAPEIAQDVEQALEPYAKPQPADAAPVPVADRIDWEALRGVFGDIEAIIERARRQAEDDDDDDLLLLS